MSDLSRTTIDGLGALGTISDEDAAKLPATTRMFLEASPDWEKRARGWWRKGIEGGRDVHYWDLGDACLGMAKPSAADRPALAINRIKPHEDSGTDWMAGLHMGGPR